MDSVLGEDPTLPLDFSYRPDMFASTSSADQNQLPTHNQVQGSDVNFNDDSLPSGGHFMNGRISPGNNRNIKDYGTQISELKKENFSLKLRIFYMEERMMEQFSGDHDQVWKTNIELKVECDSLRKELGEKHDLLVKASNAVACIDAGNPEEVRKVKLEAEREIAQMRELMNEKLADSQKELELARHDSEQALEQALLLKKELLDVHQENSELKTALEQANEALESAQSRQNPAGNSSLLSDSSRDCNDSTSQSDELAGLQQQINELRDELDEKKRAIQQLQNNLTTKQTLIELLNEEKETMTTEHVGPLVKEIEALKEKLKVSEAELKDAKQSEEKSRQNYQDHITEQQQRLDEFELATKQVSEELDKREIEVKDLKEALRDAEDTVEKLTTKADHDSTSVQSELDRAKKDIHKRDRAITGLTQVVQKKDEEIGELSGEVDKLRLDVDSLRYEIELKESKTEELLREFQRYQAEKVESSPSKDELLQQLRDQLRESDAALQALRSQEKNSRLSENYSDTDILYQFKEPLLEAESSGKVFSSVSAVNEALLLQLREQLLVSESNLQTQNGRLKQLQEQLKESDLVLQDALDEKSHLEDERDRCAREFNQKTREQGRQMDRLKSQIADLEATVASLEDDVKQRDRQVQQLTNKRKKLAKELQESREEISHIDEEHNDRDRTPTPQNRENDKQIDLLRSQVADYEETVLAMDGKIKEKDWQLQDLANKHKKLTKELQEKEEERIKAVMERDELLSQCEEEKNRFSTLANKMLKRSGSEMSSSSSIAESAASSQIKKLEDELEKKNRALDEATSVRDNAIEEQVAACHELQQALAARDRKITEGNRELSLKEVEIRELRDLLRDSEDKLHECENKMSSEINKLVRQNSDLRDKLRSSEDELVNLKSKPDSLASYSSDNSRRAPLDPKTFKSKFNQEISEEIKELRRQLAIKDDEIKKIRRIRRSIDLSEPDEISIISRSSRNVTFDHEKPHFKRDFHDDSNSDATDEDRLETGNKAPSFNRLRQVHSQNRKDLTFDTTLGLPLDETSYMSIADARLGDDSNLSVTKLRQELANARATVADAERELYELRLASAKQIDHIHSLERMVEEKAEESQALMQRCNESNQERLAKEAEIVGLLERVKRSDAKRKRFESDSATSESDGGLLSAGNRRKSGEESEGMSSLSRRELCETIDNLKKKLDNAEKVNDLLKKQMQAATDDDDKKSHPNVNPQLVAELAAEVERLKKELEARNDLVEKSLPSRTSVLPSKLPLPKNSKISNRSLNPLRPELDRARLLNRKLNEQLVATEQTVRIQAEKLNRCRVAFKEAGVLSPPISPIRAANSVPNLRTVPDLRAANEKVDSSDRRNRSRSVDRTEVGMQTDKKISVSPKSEQRFNSLIQTQAKELSQLREQLKKSRDTCKHLQTEMDIVSRYLKAFLHTSDNLPDPSIISGIEEEIERSKKLVAKLRRGLTDNVDELNNSEVDSDQPILTTPLPLAALENHQLERLKDEVAHKNDEIARLKEKVKNLRASPSRSDRNRSAPDTPYPAEKWLSTPDLQHPYSATSVATQFSSPSTYIKKQPSSAGSSCHRREEHVMLTPASSHTSLHTPSDEDISHPAPLGVEENHRHLHSKSFEQPQRASWPIDRNQAASTPGKRRSMPMYQRTIAVTEYLPPNIKSDKGRSFSAAVDASPASVHRLPTSDPFQCSASYGGRWGGDDGSPQNLADDLRYNIQNKHSPPWESTRVDLGDSSCDEGRGEKNHKLAREVDRLRRRLTDSKKINRSLKEELDLANKSLIHARDSLQPGYHVTPHRDAEILAEHLNEIRQLRQRLEQSIATNDRLREKLEKKLNEPSQGSKEHLSANIYLEADDGRRRNSSEVHDLQKKLEKAENDNESLKKRLKAEEKAHSTYEDAVREMKAMQQNMIEKADKIERLTDHVQQLQYELEQQTSMTDTLGEKLHSRDLDLSELKQKLEQVESEKEKLVDDNVKSNESSRKLWSEAESLRAQLEECKQLIDSLKSELALYEKLQKERKAASQPPSHPPLELNELLQEIRSLRSQLERSIEANAALRTQLEEQLKNPQSRDEALRTTINIHHVSPRSANRSSPLGARRKLKLEGNLDNENVLMTPPASASSEADDRNFSFDPLDQNRASRKNEALPSPTKELNFPSDELESAKKPLYSRGGPYTLCKTDDFIQIQQTIAKSGLIARTADNKVAEALKTVLRPTSPETRMIKDVWTSTNSLCHLLDEGEQLLRLFWPIVIPYSQRVMADDNWGRSYSSSGVATGGRCSSVATPTPGKRIASDTENSVTSETDGLRREVGRLRRRLTSQDRLLQTTVERLHNTNKLKEGIECAIVKQLSRTHDVLRKARGNLEAKAQDSGHRPHHTS